ncbi:MAG: hypothetical protein IPG45_14835 [Deltaproteobacteria bacterium]|nr:hypothetical protein [Deltaproteobacteria bacterium]
MVSALFGMVLLIVVAVGFGVWAARGPKVMVVPKTTELKAHATRDPEAGRLRCHFYYDGPEDHYALSEIDLPRSLANDLGLGVPAGWEPTPLAAEKGDDPAFVENYNRERLRLLGNQPLPPRAEVILDLPATHAGAGAGILRFTYGFQRRLGGVTRFALIELVAVSSPSLG